MWWLSSLPLWLVSVLLFVLGLSIGSFLDLLVFRAVRDEDWVKSRSRCDHCHKNLRWYDNIPLFSYLWLGGKSRCCHRPLAPSHPIIELLTGALFVWWYWAGAVFFKLVSHPLETIQPLFWLMVGVILLGIFIADSLYLIIPDQLVFPLIILAFLYRLVLVWNGAMRGEDLILTIVSGVGVTFFFWGLWKVTKGRGLGFGDIKLVLAMALLLGWPRILVGLFLAFILGSLVGMILIGLKKRKFGQVIAFGPFLIVGTGLGLVFGGQIWAWYWSILGL